MLHSLLDLVHSTRSTKVSKVMGDTPLITHFRLGFAMKCKASSYWDLLRYNYTLRGNPYIYPMLDDWMMDCYLFLLAKQLLSSDNSQSTHDWFSSLDEFQAVQISCDTMCYDQSYHDIILALIHSYLTNLYWSKLIIFLDQWWYEMTRITDLLAVLKKVGRPSGTHPTTALQQWRVHPRRGIF